MGTPFKHKNLTYIGHMAIFYVPRAKLERIPAIEARIHRFLFENYGAYTKSISPVKGFWRQNGSKHIFEDDNIEYKVSYAGKKRIPEFVDFLAEVCAVLGEEALYLEMGYMSYLVSPKGK